MVVVVVMVMETLRWVVEREMGIGKEGGIFFVDLHSWQKLTNNLDNQTTI